MSTTIDQKVVEMRFDNQHFEKNVQGTLSTLDKLKEKLNLTGASKGLENISKQANNVSFSNMESSLAALEKRFSTTGIIGMSVINNLTTAAMKFAVKLNSFMTDGILGGGLRRSQNLENAQFQLKGLLKDADKVEAVMKNVNDAVDGTAYSLDAAANVASQLAASGMTAGDKMFRSLRGVAGVAAMTNSTYEDIGRIYTQVAGQGRLMGDQLLQLSGRGMNAAATLAKYLGTTEATVRELVTQGEISFEIFADAMDEAFGEHAKKANETFNGALANVKSSLARIGAEFFTPLIKTNGPLVQFLNTAREKLNEFKAGILPVIEFLSGVATKVINFFTRAIKKLNIDKITLNIKPLEKFTKMFNKAMTPIKKASKAIDKTTTSLKQMNKIVNQVIQGSWGNGEERLKRLTKAGYNYYDIQNKVNEKLGYSFRYSSKLAGAQKDLSKSQKEVSNSQKEVAKNEEIRLEQLVKMSEAELKAIGLNEKEIDSLKEINRYAKMTGMTMDEFMKNADNMSARWLLLESIKNIGTSILRVFKAIGNAWKDVFPSTSEDTIFGITAAIYKFTNAIKISEKTSDRLRRTFRGLFAVLSLVGNIVKTVLKIAFNTLTNALGLFNLDFLELVAIAGDFLYALVQWIENNNLVVKGVKALIGFVISGAKAIKNWLSNIDFLSNGLNKLSNVLDRVVNPLKNFIGNIKTWFSGMKDAENIGQYILDGLINGIGGGAKKLFEFVSEIAKGLLEAVKEVLGIHSPSTEFLEIGKNIMAGLLNGLKEGASTIFGYLSSFAGALVEFLGNIDFGKILAAGIGIAILYMFKRILDIAETLTTPLLGFSNVLEELSNSIAKVGDGLKAKFMSEAFKNIAISIAILAASIVILSKVDTATLWSTIGAIAAITAILGGLAFAASKMGDLGDFGKSTLSIVGIAAALFIIAAAMKKLSGIDTKSMNTALKGLIAMIVGIGALMYAFGKFVDANKAINMSQAGLMMVGIGVALLLMVKVIKAASGLDETALAKGFIVIGAFTSFVSALIFVSMFAGEYAKQAGQMLMRISVALLIMVGVIKLASKLSAEEVVKGMSVIWMLGAFVSALIFVSMFAGENASKAGFMLLQISIALAIMTAVIKMIAGMEMTEIVKGFAVITALGVLITAFIAVSMLAGDNAIKAGAMILLIAGSLLVLTAVIFILSKIDTGGLVKAVGAISIIGLMFTALIYVSQYAENSMKSIIAITIAITLLMVALIGLTFIDSEKLITAASCMVAVISSLALIMAATKLLGDGKGLIKTLAPMILAVGLLTGLIYLLSNVDPTRALASSASISILLISMSAALTLASLMGSNSYKGLAALTLMTLVVGLLGGILALMSKFNVAPSIETAQALSLLLIAMSGSLILLGVVGLLGPAAFIGIAALATLIVGIGGIIVAIGALASKFPQLEEFVDKGLPILQKLGYALGSFFGNIVGGFLNGAISGVMNTLPTLGLMLSQFMLNAKPFIDGVKNVDETTLKGVGILAASILALTVTQLINGIVSLIPFMPSLSDLGTQLSNFMTNSKGFIEGANTIKPKMVEGLKVLSEAILILTGANLVQTLTKMLGGGDSSLETFGEQLEGLGKGVKSFSASVEGITDDQFKSAKNAADIIKLLAEASSKIPNSGGWLSSIVGDNDMAAWSTKLPFVAKGLSSFISILSANGVNEETAKIAKTAAKIITSLAKASTEIPNSGGWLSSIVGDNDMAAWSTKLPFVAKGLSSFISILSASGINEESAKIAKAAAEIIKPLAEVSNEIPNTGGALAALIGDNDLETFAEGLPVLGEGIAGFISKIGNLNEDSLSSINAATNAIKVISDMSNSYSGFESGDFSSFGNGMVKLAEKISEFSGTMASVSKDSIDSAITKLKDLISLTSKVAQVDEKSVNAFGNSLKKIGDNASKGFVKSLNSSTNKENAVKAVNDLINSTTGAVSRKTDSVKKKFKKVAIAGVDEMDSKSMINSAKDAGKNLVIGFVNGMNDNKYRVSIAGRSLGTAALDAAKAALDERSPSKEARKVGNFFGEGLIIGIDEYKNKTYKAGYSIADKAKVGLSKAISRISSMLENDIDSQPTIRPVLDLSEIESGANSISGMFNNPSLGLMSNINAINAGMKARNQNGINDDVVSAIDDLRRDLNNNTGVTNNYNVNGLTYDDGSNITEAVKTLIRAAVVERRA